MTNSKRGTFANWAERMEVFQRIHSIMEARNFDNVKGLCSDAGQHEGNPVQTVYFADLANEGEGETIEDMTWFRPTAIEREIFGLTAGKPFFAVRQDDNGFWYGAGHTMREKRRAERDWQAYLDETETE